jgi:hypothetical protein
LAYDIMLKHIGCDARRAEGFAQLAKIQYDRGKFLEASKWCKTAIECEWHDNKMFLNPTMYSWWPLDKLSMCYHRMKMNDKAEEAAKLALDCPDLPDTQFIRIQKNIGYFNPDYLKTSEYYDRHWKKFPFAYPYIKERLEVMANMLEGNESILDVGCGPGWFADYLDKKVKYVGFDTSAIAREMVETRGHIAVSDIDEVGTKRFDAAILGEILEHTEDLNKFLENVCSKLKAKSLLIISVPQHKKVQDPTHVHDYTEEGWSEILEGFGSIENKIDLNNRMIFKVRYK